jgi:murein DD-endopeptidase MepM/ murein hydrolase activator NlpD
MTQFLQRTVLIALATTALTACSTTENQDSMRPSYPVRPPEAQAAPPVTTAPTPAAPVETLSPPPAAAPVQSQTLAPLPQARPAEQTLAPPPVVERPRPRPAPVAPRFETVTKKTVNGRVVEVAGRASTYTIRKGDTLEKIAKTLDTTVEDLRRDNGLKKNARLQPGDELQGPTNAAKAYVTESGDTLYSIAKRFSVTPDSLLDENKLRSPSSLHAGQRLRLPDGYKDRGPLVTSSRVQVAGSPAAVEQDEAPAPAPARRSSRGRPMPEPAVAAEPETAAASFRTVTDRSATGRLVEVEGKASSYTVKKGDNLDKIADKLNTTVADLKDDNDLKRSTIHPGQVLQGPRTSAKAYVAVSGDTLADIGKRFGVSAEALRAENGLSRRESLKPGEKIRLPDGYRDHGPIVTKTRVPVPTAQPAPEEAPTAAPVRAAPAPAPALTPTPRPYSPPPSSSPLPSSPRPYTPSSGSRTYTPPSSAGATAGPGVSSAPTVSDAQVSELGRGRFLWPLQGQIVSDFGPKGQGQRNDGINIAATAGAPVRAAAAGDVVYAGDQVPGFGNLVLIKHADGWLSAYGHLSHVDVKMQQKVAQGQQVGQAGATGGVSEPQLHFEIRFAPSPLERARPIDPKLVLPK